MEWNHVPILRVTNCGIYFNLHSLHCKLIFAIKMSEYRHYGSVNISRVSNHFTLPLSVMDGW